MAKALKHVKGAEIKTGILLQHYRKEREKGTMFIILLPLLTCSRIHLEKAPAILELRGVKTLLHQKVIKEYLL
jgi:hypothetical protein